MIEPSKRPFDVIEGVRRATRGLLTTVEELSDAQVGRGSLLPDWTRGEVVTHLARNADGLRGMAEAAERGEQALQYPGGAEQRSDDIAKGRAVNAAALRTDLRRACDALMEVWTRLDDDVWTREGATLNGPRSIARTAWSRWREVEIHHFDLDLGYMPADWPVMFVQRALDERLDGLNQPEAGISIRDRKLCVRLEATDLQRSWNVRVNGREVVVTEESGAVAQDDSDAVANGWGCDLLAWLYGRDPRGMELTFSGAPAVVEFPEWFPYE